MSTISLPIPADRHVVANGRNGRQGLILRDSVQHDIPAISSAETDGTLKHFLPNQAGIQRFTPIGREGMPVVDGHLAVPVTLGEVHGPNSEQAKQLLYQLEKEISVRSVSVGDTDKNPFGSTMMVSPTTPNFRLRKAFKPKGTQLPLAFDDEAGFSRRVRQTATSLIFIDDRLHTTRYAPVAVVRDESLDMRLRDRFCLSVDPQDPVQMNVNFNDAFTIDVTDRESLSLFDALGALEGFDPSPQCLMPSYRSFDFSLDALVRTNLAAFLPPQASERMAGSGRVEFPTTPRELDLLALEGRRLLRSLQGLIRDEIDTVNLAPAVLDWSSRYAGMVLEIVGREGGAQPKRLAHFQSRNEIMQSWWQDLERDRRIANDLPRVEAESDDLDVISLL